MNMDKHLYVTSLHMLHGGVEMMIAQMASAFAENGYTVEILCNYNLGEPVYPLHPSVKLTYLTDDQPNRREFSQAMRQKNPFKIIKEGVRAVGILRRKKRTMKAALKAIRAGTIISTRHEHSLLLSKYGAPSVKKIAQLHSDHHFDQKLLNGFRSGYAHIDYFILLTPQTEQEIRQILEGYNQHTRCVTIPNFIDPPNVSIPVEKKKQVIAAGRLHPDKDFPALLRIWSLVCSTHDDWMLKIAGEGDLKAQLEEQANQLGIAERVCFTGALSHDELLQEMANSACYALTSVSESFGLVLVEAMACAAPPVSFDIRVGPGYILENGKSGFLIPDRNETLFAEAIVRLMDSPALCRDMGQAGRERARRFYKDEIIKDWIRLLET